MPELNDNLLAILAKQGAGLPATLTGAGNLKVAVEEGGSGGGGAVTVADGADLALGATTDAAATTDAGTFSLMALVKRLLGKLPTLVSGRWPVDGSGVTQPVSGTFWQATQPVSGTFWQATQPTSDAGAAWTTLFGVSNAAVTSADLTTATAVTDAPTAGQKIVLTDLLISTDTAMSVTITEETSGRVIAKLYLPANGSAQVTLRGKTKLATADKKVKAQASVAGNVAISTWFFSEA